MRIFHTICVVQPTYPLGLVQLFIHCLHLGCVPMFNLSNCLLVMFSLVFICLFQLDNLVFAFVAEFLYSRRGVQGIFQLALQGFQLLQYNVTHHSVGTVGDRLVGQSVRNVSRDRNGQSLVTGWGQKLSHRGKQLSPESLSHIEDSG